MTMASDLESNGHILFPMADYVGGHTRIKIFSLTISLREMLISVHLHYILDTWSD